VLGKTAAVPAWRPPARDRPGDQRSLRDVLAVSADPEAAFLAGPTAAELRAELDRLAAQAGPLADPADPAGWQQTAAAWAAAEARRFTAVAAPPGDPDAQAGALRRAVLGCAPLGLVSGAWLQWLSSPGRGDDPVWLQVLALYATDVGAGQPGTSRGHAYLTLLRRLRVAESAVPAARIALDQRIGEAAFYLPALLLAMSRRPAELADHILGADLCLRSAGLPPALVPVRQALPAAADWPAIDLSAAPRPGQPPGAALARAAVAARLAAGPAAARDRLVLGFRWALAALRQGSDALYAELAAARDPAFEMAELIRSRAREGAVYHSELELAGRSLQQWLRDGCSDPDGLLRALAGSPLVRPGRPDASPLINSLIGERGPMFRVFTAHEVAVIRRWIRSLAPDGPIRARPGPARPAAGWGPRLVPAFTAAPEPGSAPRGLRDAYCQLQSREDPAALRRFAHGYVQGWLARARWHLDGAAGQLPPRWPAAGLRSWLLDQHDRRSQEFTARQWPPPPSRAEVIDTMVQRAPVTLIDGSWLQGFTDYRLASSEVGFSLFATYFDELGNGEPGLNHPLLYRELLQDMGVALPPTAAPAFAHWPGFRDSSFGLAVFWLSVGRYPRTYLPEILGLNLAMELSGVGGAYRRDHLALARYGFSTRFADIHNTIDNVATGHAAWAAEAIDTYLTGLGAVAAAAAWPRIRVGFRSLSPPEGRRARWAARRIS
jgi:hypothetical protein